MLCYNRKVVLKALATFHAKCNFSRTILDAVSTRTKPVLVSFKIQLKSKPVAIEVNGNFKLGTRVLRFTAVNCVL